jgi:hypothetical protein
MSLLSRWRVLRHVIAALLLCIGLCGILLASLYLHALMFRNRGQRLLDEIAALQAGTSPFEDAQKIANEYKSNLTIESQNCSATECRFYVRLISPSPFGQCCRLLRNLGIRPAMFVAYVSVRKGVVRFASFHASYRTVHGHWLDARTTSVESFGLLDRAQDLGLQLHPGYAVEVGTITTIGGGEFISAAYAPDANSNERRIVTDIRLSCLTKMPDCSTVGELMPESAAALDADTRWITENHSRLSPLRTQLYKELWDKYGSPPWNEAKSFW